MTVSDLPVGNRAAARLGTEQVGPVLVVYHGARAGADTRHLASRIPLDPENDLLLLDLPAEAPARVWHDLVRILDADQCPRPGKGLRLIAQGHSRTTSTLVAAWLCERLGRVVIAAEGPMSVGLDGALFVGLEPNTGWIRFSPGASPHWESNRFPRPDWEADVANPPPVGPQAVVEPLPGGLWLRPTVGSEASFHKYRTRLIDSVPLRPDAVTIVVGSPGSSPVRLEDVARVRGGLSPRTRQRSRVAPLGPVVLPDRIGLGQALANLTGEELLCYNGIPIGGGARAVQVRLIHPDGRAGELPFAGELGYRPRSPAEDRPAPWVFTHRPPLGGLSEISPGVYRHGPDALIEVVQSGLLIRTDAESIHTAAIRRAQPDPARTLLIVDGNHPETVGRLRGLAEKVLDRLPEPVRGASQIVRPEHLVGSVGAALAGPVEPPPVADLRVGAGSAPSRPGELSRGLPPIEPVRFRLESPGAVEPVLRPPGSPSPAGPMPSTAAVTPAPPSPVAEVPPKPAEAPPKPAEAPPKPAEADESPVGVAEPAPSRAEPVVARLQPMPPSSARGILPSRPIEEERAWLRKSLARDFGTMANSVARVLSQHPGFEGVRDGSSAALTDAVAVRLYLTPRGAKLDAALRTGAVGPHIPFARCLVAGLSRLPSHRGPTSFAASLDAGQWALYRANPVVAEWGFINAVSGPCVDQPGDTDVLIWSMTGRRTRLLEPETGGVPTRVLFVPGTRFKVLDLTEPGPDRRGTLIMRELIARDLAADGQVDSAQQAFDELALTTMRRDHETWARARRPVTVSGASATHFGALPGLM